MSVLEYLLVGVGMGLAALAPIIYLTAQSWILLIKIRKAHFWTQAAWDRAQRLVDELEHAAALAEDRRRAGGMR